VNLSMNFSSYSDYFGSASCIMSSDDTCYRILLLGDNDCSQPSQMKLTIRYDLLVIRTCLCYYEDQNVPFGCCYPFWTADILWY
jgi:hypothetical protein